MQTQSLSISNDLPKLNNTKDTKDTSELMLLNQKISKSQVARTNNTSLYYDHIPMPKPLPQWNQSATTLRHSPSYHRFSQSQRFPTSKSPYKDTQKLYIASSLSKRSNSVGYGSKSKIPEVFSSGAGSETKLCPHYNIDVDGLKRSNSELSAKAGKTFGLGWKHYEASRATHRNTVHSSYQVRSNPGPNHYKINPQKRENLVKMHQRLPMFSTLNGRHHFNQPSPQSYCIKEELVKSQQRSTSLGFGHKTDFTKHREKTPGPAYSFHGFCDKFVNLKIKLAQI